MTFDTLFDVYFFVVRKIFRTLRKSNTLMSPPSIDVKPIAKEELVPTYLKNTKDSDLGFRREYEVNITLGVYYTSSLV